MPRASPSCSDLVLAALVASVAGSWSCSPHDSRPISRPADASAALPPPVLIANVENRTARGYGWNLSLWADGRALLEWSQADPVSGEQQACRQELDVGVERAARILGSMRGPKRFDGTIGDVTNSSVVRRLILLDPTFTLLAEARIGTVAPANFPEKFDDEWEWTLAVASLELWRDLEGLFADPPSVRPTLRNPGLIRHQFDATIFELRRAGRRSGFGER